MEGKVPAKEIDIIKEKVLRITRERERERRSESEDHNHYFLMEVKSDNKKQDSRRQEMVIDITFKF